MSVQRISQVYNPITGVFGNGFVQVFGPGMSGTWTVPPGVNACRVRLWGGGGGATGGGGGGFAMKTIYALGVSTVAITVGNSAQTSSFGSFVSASGGTSGSPYTGGSGSGGDINTSGGDANSAAGGGAGSLFGRGSGANLAGVSGGAFGPGFTGGVALTVASGSITGTGSSVPWSIDFIGTGGVASNGGGGTAANGYGGFPGGGAYNGYGGAGLVIVEW